MPANFRDCHNLNTKMKYLYLITYCTYKNISYFITQLFTTAFTQANQGHPMNMAFVPTPNSLIITLACYTAHVPCKPCHTHFHTKPSYVTLITTLFHVYRLCFFSPYIYIHRFFFMGWGSGACLFVFIYGKLFHLWSYFEP